MKTLLTVAAIARFKPDLHRRREIKDGGAPSLYLVIQPSGAKSWAMRFRRPGGTTWGKLVLGPLDLSNNELTGTPVIGQPLTLTAARQLAATIHRERALGKDVIADQRTARSRNKSANEHVSASTFGMLVRQYVKEHAKPKTRRWPETARNLGLLYPLEGEPTVARGGLAERWADRQVTSIDGHDIHGVVDEARRRGMPGLGRRNDGISDARGRAMGRTLSKFFAWLLQHRRITNNPSVGVWCPPPPQRRKRVLSDTEIRWFWQAAGGLGTPFGPLLRLLLLTGQRLNEVGGICCDELQEDGWQLPGSRTKNKLEHMVPLSPLAVELIDSVPLIEGCPFVFSTTGKKPVSGWSKTKSRLDAAMLAIAQKEDQSVRSIDRWVLHDLRRTAVTNMNKLKILPHVVEATVNHISTGALAGVAGTYNKYEYFDEKKEALQRWALHLRGMVGGSAANVLPLEKKRR
jgi:integrase